MILFDVLDRSADDWQEMYRVIRGLLQTVLDMRGYRRLRMKVFLRTDQMEESDIADFPTHRKSSLRRQSCVGHVASCTVCCAIDLPMDATARKGCYAARKSSTDTSACFRIALRVPSGTSPG